jgi:hypothetical protein
MLSFENFINRYILFDENVIPQDKIFTWEHFLMTFLVLLLYSLLFVFVFKKKSDVNKTKFVNLMCWIMLGVELFRVCWNMILRYESGYNLLENFLMAERFDLCNQVTIFLPIIFLTKSKKFYSSIVCLALLGGVTILLYPKWVFHDYAGLHLMSILSMFSHGLMVFISILIINLKLVEYKQKNWYIVLSGLVIIILISICMSLILDGPRTNFLETKVSTLPVFKEIPWPFYMFFQFPLMGEVLLLVYCLLIFITNKIEKEKNTFNKLLIIDLIAIVITLSGIVLTIQLVN